MIFVYKSAVHHKAPFRYIVLHTQFFYPLLIYGTLIINGPPYGGLYVSVFIDSNGLFVCLFSNFKPTAYTFFLTNRKPSNELQIYNREKFSQQLLFYFQLFIILLFFTLLTLFKQTVLEQVNCIISCVVDSQSLKNKLSQELNQ